MKSKTSENSDRLIVIYRLQASGKVNRSDEQEELQERAQQHLLHGGLPIDQ